MGLAMVVVEEERFYRLLCRILTVRMRQNLTHYKVRKVLSVSEA